MNDELTMEVLKTYGFKVKDTTSKNRVALSKNGFDITIMGPNTILHSIANRYYPLNNLDDLKRMYQKSKETELTLHGTILEDQLVKKGKFSPEITFLLSGRLNIAGRSLLKYSSEIYSDASEWLIAFDKTHPPLLELNIMLDALDTASVRCIVDLVKLLNTFKNCKKIRINWCYEKFDDDLMDIGSAIQQLSKTVEFNLVEIEGQDISK